MRKLKSLSEFNAENVSLNKDSMSQINGGLVDGQSYECENRNTSDSWNCGDTESRTRRDGGSWSVWVNTGNENPDGTWTDGYGMPC
jgi:hypothetical protein